MRILLAHNYTKGFATGGEGHVVEDEANILEAHGHKVCKLFCSNSEATDASLFGKACAFWNAPWSHDGYNRMATAIREFKPDVVHVHNFFLIFSPSVFKAAYDLNVPVAVTLHNYRMVSPCSQLLRNDKICELCVGRNPWRILLYRCYKNSFWASLLRYRSYYSSRRKYKWERYINAFVALTDFGKTKLMQSGLPEEKLFVVPNCASDPIDGQEPTKLGRGALFVGTVTRDKGISQLIEAWRKIDYPLTIVGEGDLRKDLEASAPKHVRFVGVQPRERVKQFYSNCAFIVMPSLCYEGFGLVSIEAMAMGRAVAVSGHGAVGSVVEDGVNGLHFIPGNVGDMRMKMQRLIDDHELTRKLGQCGRRTYLAKYTPEKHYENLMKTYEKISSRGANSALYP